MGIMFVDFVVWYGSAVVPKIWISFKQPNSFNFFDRQDFEDNTASTDEKTQQQEMSKGQIGPEAASHPPPADSTDGGFNGSSPT